MPLAFFCTLFFRHRKKSVSAPWDGKSHSRAEVGASGPHKGNFHGKLVASRCLQGAFRSPPAPLRIASEVNEYPMKVISPSLTPESARHSPSKGNFLGRGFSLRSKQGGFPLAPCTPFGESAYPHRTGVCASGRVGGFPRGKQSAQPALPCVPLVVCLNSGSLTAFGGCIHWIPASLRSLPDPFGSPPEAIERPIGLQALLPRRSRRVNPRRGRSPKTL